MTSGINQVSGSQRQQLPEEVASYVRELIISGQLKPGEFLRIEPLAEAVGVSTTPVREALSSLASQGFVKLIPRRGFVVAPFAAQDIHDLFWAQAQLGGELAFRAAKNITPEGICRLERLVEQYHEAVDAGDEDALPQLGHQFHREVNLAADSYRLTLLLGSMVRHLPNRFYASIEGRIDETQNDHPVILEALRARNAREARTLMRQHLVRGARHLTDTLRDRGRLEP